MRLWNILLLSFVVFSSSSTLTLAQNFSSNGSTWSGSWGFGSASDKNISLSQAQTIRNAENGPTITSQSNYNTSYDNRSNYVEVSSELGDVNTELQDGDNIGENTYAVGSLNTGSTTISLDGDENTINAINSADTVGCINASILNASLEDDSSFPVETCE